MPLATFEEANAWLDGTKIAYLDANDAADDANNADNVVKAYLAANWPEPVLLWDAAPAGAQEKTPEIVADAASLLMASYLYARKYSEETDGEARYATQLEKRAIEILEKLQSGDLTLFDKIYGSDIANSLRLEQADFWPNDTTTVEHEVFDEYDESVSTISVPDRKFSMSMPI